MGHRLRRLPAAECLGPGGHAPGRLDDVFVYPDGQVVHPHVFGSLLRRDPGIVEYQVRQTPAGAEILVVGAPAGPAVEVAVVGQLERQAAGKVRRFLPQPVASLASSG